MGESRTISREEYPYELVCKETQTTSVFYWIADIEIPGEGTAGCGATILYLKTITPGTKITHETCTWPDRPARNKDKLCCLECGREPIMVSGNFRKRLPENAENMDGGIERYEGPCLRCGTEGWLNWRKCSECHDQQERFLAEKAADEQLDQMEDA